MWMSGMDDRRGAAWSACVVPKTTTGTDEDDQRGLIGRVRGKTPKGAAGDLCPVHDLKTKLLALSTLLISPLIICWNLLRIDSTGGGVLLTCCNI